MASGTCSARIACLWSCLDQVLEPLPARVMAFRPGVQSNDAAIALLWLLQKADEWDLPLAVASMDVRMAFDGMPHDIIAESLVASGAGPELAVA